MYTQKDFDKAKRGMLLRMGLTLCMVALVCVGCGLCMQYRIRWANALIAGAGMAAAAVYFTLKAMPWWRYFRLMRDIETGRSHEYDVRFLSFSSGCCKLLLFQRIIRITEIRGDDLMKLFPHGFFNFFRRLPHCDFLPDQIPHSFRRQIHCRIFTRAQHPLRHLLNIMF